MPKNQKAGMSKTHAPLQQIKVHRPEQLSKEEVEHMTNDLKQKHRVAQARSAQAEKKQHQKVEMLENRVAKEEAKLEKAQRVKDNEDTYTLVGRILLGVAAATVLVGFVLLSSLGIMSLIAMLSLAFLVLVISIAFQFMPLSAEKTLREDTRKLRNTRAALSKVKNRH